MNGCVEVESAFYSAPPGWIGRKVTAQWDGRTVRVIDPRTGHLLREHQRQERGHYRIPDEDLPTKTPPTTQNLLNRCARIGVHTGSVAEQMYRRDGVIAIRRIQGLHSLARKHGAALTEEACAAALDVGLPGNPYNFAKRWLDRRPPLTLRQVDPIIRQLTLYRDFINNKTQEDPEE